MLSLTSSALYAQVLSYNVNQSNHRALELFESYHLRLGCRSRAILGQECLLAISSECSSSSIPMTETLSP